jgi:hypothetical protein
MSYGYQQGYPQPNVPPQYYPQQPVYQHEPMTLLEWILCIVLSGIPLLGFILLLVWSFSSRTNPTKKLWARAMVIVEIAGFVLSLVFYASGIFTLTGLLGY